jgi:hypothetical protein
MAAAAAVGVGWVGGTGLEGGRVIWREEGIGEGGIGGGVDGVNGRVVGEGGKGLPWWWGEWLSGGGGLWWWVGG